MRSVPTLNDATLAEARQTGMDGLVEVMENGIDGPFFGTTVDRCSKEVQGILNLADAIVSKGGGNFDSLSFLFHRECGLLPGVPPTLERADL